MGENTTESVADRLQKLWDNAETYGPPVSPLMEFVKREIGVALEAGNMWSLDDAARQIARHVELHMLGHGTIAEVAGEWHVTHADLERWSRLSLFGRRDYFPDRWWFVRNTIGGAVHEKRRWQTFVRYRENGLTNQHRKLAANLIWDFDLSRGDWVSLYVQGKRPFGNSGVESDVADAVGWTWPGRGEDDDEGMPHEMEERCWELFEELQFAVPDIIASASGAGADSRKGSD